MRRFKVGDKVILNRPINIENKGLKGVVREVLSRTEVIVKCTYLPPTTTINWPTNKLYFPTQNLDHYKKEAKIYKKRSQ